MGIILNKSTSIANQFMAEIRDVNVQKDRLRFRTNLERLGEILAYEISKTFTYEVNDVETPFGVATIALPSERIVLAVIQRAGNPFHQGFLKLLDKADNAFIAANRVQHKDGTFDIKIESLSVPSLDDAVLIMIDPMIATGATMDLAIQSVLAGGKPKRIHIASCICSEYGFQHLKSLYPEVSIWTGAIDEELTGKSYVVPGLGDAGQLALGPKLRL